ncbi:TetR family transcriptional regulator [Gordonia sp. (in: high G+C Gram-positive bacteria)]|uniref:TetR/AcrR family transcriptional regulator n=1 Tax=Gordonia sp. (in: high G+C Gram-positive bacteria) TaxID=84139 RepID=UPI003C714F1E
MTDSPRRRGRRPGAPDTRDAILAAARESFARDGFDKTSVRAIAEAAGVDAALVHHYFGTKRKLFIAAVEIPVDPEQVLSGLMAVEVEDLGRQLILTIVGLWDGDAGPAAVALVKANLSAPDPAMLRSFLTEIVLAAIGERLTSGDHVALRTSLTASQLLGVLVSRHILKLDPIATMPLADLADMVGPTLQRYLTGQLS